jgi:hypothetical protein
MMYVRELSPEEFQALKEMSRKEIGRVSQRAHIVLMSAKRWQCPPSRHFSTSVRRQSGFGFANSKQKVPKVFSMKVEAGGPEMAMGMGMGPRRIQIATLWKSLCAI